MLKFYSSVILPNFFKTLAWISILSLLSGNTPLFAQLQKSPVGNGYRVGFYNLENLFHPSDDSLTADEEFTPEGARHWSEYKYRVKINQMAKAILSLGEWESPAIIGLEEVECRQVVQDLIESRVLSKYPYRLVHYESPDRRGIDVALIYRRDLFELIYSMPVRLSKPGEGDLRTRDMLYVKGIASNSDTLHLVVCHWPSRYGGQASSEPRRVLASKILGYLVDSLLSADPQANIIIGGDFNDEPLNQSMLQALPKGV